MRRTRLPVGPAMAESLHHSVHRMLAGATRRIQDRADPAHAAPMIAGGRRPKSRARAPLVTRPSERCAGTADASPPRKPPSKEDPCIACKDLLTPPSPGPPTRPRETRGQGTVEYVALILLVALVMAGVVAAMKGFRTDEGKELGDVILVKIKQAVRRVQF